MEYSIFEEGDECSCLSLSLRKE